VGVLGRRSFNRPHGCNGQYRPHRYSLRLGRICRLYGRHAANPTFLTLVNPDQPNPQAALTAVIYGHDRAKFGTPETALQGQRVCVTGQISFFRGRAEMILSTPSQLAYSAPPSVAQLR
jgi:hypothetical protein